MSMLPTPQHCGPSLSMQEAQRVQRYQERLERALAARDRQALRSTKQAVLSAAYQSGAGHISPALRQALRQLSWRMAAMLLTRDRCR